MNDDDPHLRAPLAPLAGDVPPAPAWFTRALAVQPEAGELTVDGARLETLAWGQVGRPGLLLMHGNGAHAGWWRFIAPFFADTHRVAAFTWSGMGRSDHRPRYSSAGFAAEAAAVARALELFDAEPAPVMVGHSFGGFPMMTLAARPDSGFGGAVIVDTPFHADREGRRPPPTHDGHRLYPTLAAALARFRFAPVQTCENLYIADLIARESLIEITGENADNGWRWAFDPGLFREFAFGDPTPLLAAARCPVALIWGDRSRLMPPATIAAMLALLPAGTPAIAIPDAAHHVMVDQPLALVAALRALLATGWSRP